MDSKKVATFIKLAGQKISKDLITGDPATRELGAQLLLSETLEYVIKGLGVIPVVDGTAISDPNALKYKAVNKPDKVEMIDGLADVAYTMYWNALRLGIPLEEAHELVCDNNLEKFVRLDAWNDGARALERSEWDCGKSIDWPKEVVQVEVIEVGSEFYAVGKDETGKVRKPSSYKSVDLSSLLSN